MECYPAPVNRAYYQATASNEHCAKAGYGVEHVPQSGRLSGLPPRTDLGCFRFPVHAEELLLLMQSRDPCKCDTREHNYFNGTKTSGQK